LVRIKRQITGVIALATLIASAITISAQQTAADSSAFQHMLDSLGIKKSDLEAKVQSTLLFGGSAPVSFSGEGRLRMQYHQIDDAPKYLEGDKTYLQSNWEGNESFIRMGMVVRAGRNAVLWSKIGFQNTLPGNYFKQTPGGSEIPSETHKDGSPAIVHEDMNAGIAIRTVPVSFMLKMGSVQWIESSPLTVWKSQPRTFAWEYLPFEVEQPIARYFEYNLAKGEKAGRAAWNKKAFQGVNLESINLPGNLYFNFVYGAFERFDNFEREYIDFSNDIAYSGDAGLPAKGFGIGDSYRHIFFGKLGANELFGHLTPSLDFTFINYEHDIYTMGLFSKVFKFTKVGAEGFYKQPLTTSFDLRGPVSDKLTIHGNIALNHSDTIFVKMVSDSVSIPGQKRKAIEESRKGTPINSAAYLRMESKYTLPVNVDLAYIGKGFYSPMSFAAPVDAFFPFGANLLGPGKFIARGEASPYTQNMAGINLQVVPNLPGYGHLKFTYGQHFQLESAQDVIFFPYRLNGQDLSSLFQSSFNRWGNDPIDHSMIADDKNPTQSKYYYRMGDEGFRSTAFNFPRGPMAGGLRTDYLSAYEGFVPYPDAAMADSNYNLIPKYDSSSIKAGNFITYVNDTGAVHSIKNVGKVVPKHQKFTFNAEFDGSYDIGPLVGYPRDLFLGLYAAVNGVSTSFKALATSDKSKDMLLWGTYLRFEPAIAVTNKFYILGVAGFENWRAQNTYMYLSYFDNKNASDIAKVGYNLGDSAKVQFAQGKKLFMVPIDYRDYALGVGFDWDVLARVGLHGRVKWMKHDDVNFKSNNWQMPIVSAEIKMWF
jgi:hypothetical protein